MNVRLEDDYYTYENRDLILGMEITEDDPAAMGLASEEVVTRSYLYQRLMKTYKKPIDLWAE